MKKDLESYDKFKQILKENKIDKSFIDWYQAFATVRYIEHRNDIKLGDNFGKYLSILMDKRKDAYKADLEALEIQILEENKKDGEILEN